MWPDRYLDELVAYLADEQDTDVSMSTVSRELKRADWSKKKNRQIALQGDLNLQDLFTNNISSMQETQLVFMDGLGCGPRHGFRPNGLAPLGITPSQCARFQRGQRHRILPAYTVDAVLSLKGYKGSAEATVFE